MLRPTVADGQPFSNRHPVEPVQQGNALLAVLRYRLRQDLGGDRAYMGKLIQCSTVPGLPEGAADAPQLETDEEAGTVGIAAAGFTGVGAASLGVIVCGPVPTPNDAFRIAASLAAISARF